MIDLAEASMIDRSLREKWHSLITMYHTDRAAAADEGETMQAKAVRINEAYRELKTCALALLDISALWADIRSQTARVLSTAWEGHGSVRATAIVDHIPCIAIPLVHTYSGVHGDLRVSSEAGWARAHRGTVRFFGICTYCIQLLSHVMTVPMRRLALRQVIYRRSFFSWSGTKSEPEPPRYDFVKPMKAQDPRGRIEFMPPYDVAPGAVGSILSKALVSCHAGSQSLRLED